MPQASTEASDQPLTYAASGVDIDLESTSVKTLISALGAGARARGTRGALVPHAGGFSGLLEFGDSLLALCTDGVGSKLLLAEQLSYFESIAHDCVAMNVNDLVCIGAEPLGFVDYIAAPRPDPAVWAALGRSLASACRAARVSLAGGESASLPDMVKGLDMSGTALGWLPRGKQLDGRSVAAGDVLIGLPASGVHSNGLSLVRRVLQQSGASLRDAAPFAAAEHLRAGTIWRHRDGGSSAASSSSSGDAVTLGEVLLNPTYIYVDPVVDLFMGCREGAADAPCPYDDLHGIVHVTGGGLSNLLRLRDGVGFEIRDAMPVLPEFEWLQSVGGVSDEEMLRTFNMGMGMVIVVASSAAESVSNWLAARLPGSREVGVVTDDGVVRHTTSGVSFDRY